MPRIFAKMKNIDFCVPTKPHVDYKEGGHLFIEPSNKSISERIEMTREQLIDMAYATQLLGYAMWTVLPRHGIQLYRLNYQDNGNWSFLRGDDHALMHVHIYGRSKDEEKQEYGQALVFPDPDDPYYDDIDPIPDEVLVEISDCMREALAEGKFDIPYSEDDLNALSIEELKVQK